MKEPAADEFRRLGDLRRYLAISDSPALPVERCSLRLSAGRLSLVSWGGRSPHLVLLHGGGQNARTWDAVALLLRRPAIAFDLPGHGHSSWRVDRDYGAFRNGAAIAEGLRQLRAGRVMIVGMSLGGLTAIHLAAVHPDLVSKIVLVDVTPASGLKLSEMGPAERGPTALLDGPRTFDTFEEIVERVAAVLPGRTLPSIRRSVELNTRSLPGGGWAWRHDIGGTGFDHVERAALWDELGRIRVPTMLVRAEGSAFVTEDDVEEFTRRRPDARVELVADSGHSVQSDQPARLATLVESFLQSPEPGAC